MFALNIPSTFGDSISSGTGQVLVQAISNSVIDDLLSVGQAIASSNPHISRVKKISNEIAVTFPSSANGSLVDPVHNISGISAISTKYPVIRVRKK